MQGKKAIVWGGLLALLLLGAVWLRQEEKAPESQRQEPTEGRREEITAQIGQVEEEILPATDPLSITAFSQKEFVGEDFTVGEVLEKNSAYTRYYITYRSDGLLISGIMNVPAGTPPVGGFPVLFLNHGYIDPAVYTNGRGLKREQDYLARQGYVVVHSDYRNHAASDDDPDTEINFRFGYAEDVINGIQALKTANLPYVDSERIGMLGHSMGGGVAYLVAIARPELVEAIVLFAPVSSEAWDNFNQYTRNRRETAEKILEKYQTPEENEAFWKGVSPINYFDRITVPILIQHGTLDDSTPLPWSEKSLAALEASGREAKMDVYPGEPHEFINVWPTVMRRTTEFFDEHLEK